MLPVLRIGPAAIPVGPLALLVAFFLALEVGDRAARRLRLRADLISSVGEVALVVGLVAARVAYLVENRSAYQVDWSQVFALNAGTLDATAGTLVGLAAGYIYLQRRKVNLRPFADALAPALALALAVISFGNLMTGDAYGAIARGLPWAIQLWGEPRHPVQVYELLAYGGIFAWLWSRAPRLFDGAQFLLAVMLLAGARLLLEPFRGDSVAWVAGLRSAQVLALGLMTGAALLFVRGVNLTPRSMQDSEEARIKLAHTPR